MAQNPTALADSAVLQHDSRVIRFPAARVFALLVLAFAITACKIPRPPPVPGPVQPPPPPGTAMHI